MTNCYNNYPEEELREDNKEKELQEKICEMWQIIDDLKHKVAEERELLKREKHESETLIKEHSQQRPASRSVFPLPIWTTPAAECCPVHKSNHTLPSNNNFVKGSDYQNIFQEEDLFKGDYNHHYHREMIEILQNHECKSDPEEDLFPEVSLVTSPLVIKAGSTNIFTQLKADRWINEPEQQEKIENTPAEPHITHQS